jgi:cytochrome c-type biogenesis protein CcmH/NrfG
VSVGSEEAWEAAQEGAELIAEGEPARAVRELEQLIAREPKNAYGYFFLGAAHFELGDYAKALRAYVTALELEPGYLGAMVGAGHALRTLGRYDQAIRMGQQLLARDKNDAEALFLLGASHFARGDNAAAEDFLSRFAATNPEVEIATEAEGMLQVIRGQIVPIEPEGEPD